MKTYKCHKKVQAAKIESIRALGAPGSEPVAWGIFFTEDEGHAQVTNEWLIKHAPKPGGYLVIYEDGYLSFSPGHVFEKGYALETRPEVTRAQAIDYVTQAMGEGYEPRYLSAKYATDDEVQEDYGRCWEWYNLGEAKHDLVDTGLVNCAGLQVVQVDGESFEMGGVKYEGNAPQPTADDHRIGYQARPESFNDAARPLIKWLAENAHPHHTVIVTSTEAELLQGEYVFPTKEYLKD